MKWRKLPRAHVSYLKISELMSPSRVSLQTNTHAVTCSGHRSELLSRGGLQTHTHTHRHRRTQTHTKPSAAQLPALLSHHGADTTGCYIYLFIYLFFAVQQTSWGEAVKVENKEGEKIQCVFTYRVLNSPVTHSVVSVMETGPTPSRRSQKIYIKKTGIYSITCTGWMINKWGSL